MPRDDGLPLPEARDLDEAPRAVLIRPLAGDATPGSGWDGGRPWVRLTRRGNILGVPGAARDGEAVLS